MAHFSPWTKCYGDLEVSETRANNSDGRILNLINSKWHPLHTSQYVWTKSILPNLILTCMGDRMEMAHSIEGRTPFLDHLLTEYVNNLPPSMKIRHDPKTGAMVEKWILREAGRPFITEEAYRRKKHAFTAPIVYPAHEPLHDLLAGLMTRENVEQLGFVDWSRVQGLGGKAFGLEKDQSAMRFAITVAQWVILSKRLLVERAPPLVSLRAVL
jgi:asparagine synthase (glutamine-hydrolysing)